MEPPTSRKVRLLLGGNLPYDGPVCTIMNYERYLPTPVNEQGAWHNAACLLGTNDFGGTSPEKISGHLASTQTDGANDNITHNPTTALVIQCSIDPHHVFVVGLMMPMMLVIYDQ